MHRNLGSYVQGDSSKSLVEGGGETPNSYFAYNKNI